MAAPARVVLVDQGGRGGITDYTTELARALAARGIAVELATARDHRYPPLPGVEVLGRFPYVRGGTPLRDLVRRTHLHKALNAAGHLVATATLMRRARRAGVVHVQGFEWPPFFALMLALLRLAGATVVHTPHNSFARGSGGRVDLLWGGSDAIVMHTDYDLGELPPAARAKARVIPHGDYGAIARAQGEAPSPEEARSALDVADGALVCLCFGQLRRDKRLGDALRAVAEVPGLELVIAGEDLGGLDGEDDAVAALGERVLVRRGFVRPAAVAELFAAADVVLLPYEVASMSGVLLLGYGFGVPPVAYPVGGLPEAIDDGVTGWVCAEPTWESLAATLHDVRADGRAETGARGRAGREMAERRFAWDSVAERTADLYCAAMAGR